MQNIPLAYKFVMFVAMIGFVDHYAPRLKVPVAVPLKVEEIQRIGVRAPRCDNIMTMYGGGMRVNNYSFSFNDGFFVDNRFSTFTGYFVVTKLEDDGMTSFGIPMLHLRESSHSLMERASLMPYSVSTNDLPHIAENYLAALDVDPNDVSTSHLLVIDRGLFHSERGLVPSPLMVVYWGRPLLRDPGSNGVAFEISSVSGQLLELNVGNACGCKALPLLRNLGQLLAISDEDFVKYSDLERSNLVVRFANVPSEMMPAMTSLYHWFPQTNAQFGK
jgi:hypothetical protein